MVGFGDMLQQTPLTVTSAPPSKVTFPPLDAVFDVITETAVVLTVGVVVEVVKLTSLPYPVPALFVAYART